MFCEKLNEYMDLLHCSGKEFAEYSGISEATISRYKSGTREPKPNSDDMKKICRGICSAAVKNGIGDKKDPAPARAYFRNLFCRGGHK